MHLKESIFEKSRSFFQRTHLREARATATPPKGRFTAKWLWHKKTVSGCVDSAYISMHINKQINK